MQLVYLNGDFIPASEAKISIFDRGFLFGDSIYEVVPVFRNRFIGISEHLDRLERSLQAIQMPMPVSKKQWLDILQKLVELNALPNEDQCIYLQVTRGVKESRSHAIPQDAIPTILAMCYASPRKSLQEIAQGATAVTQEDKRRTDCFIKSTALLPNVLAFQAAIEAKAAETILIRNNFAMEGTSSNLFIVKDNTLITPPLQPQILAGVTRGFILKIAQVLQIPVLEQMISVNELFQADEVWLTGSTKEIYPITRIDNQQIGSGTPGAIWQRVMTCYQQFKLTGQFKLSSDLGSAQA